MNISDTDMALRGTFSFLNNNMCSMALPDVEENLQMVLENIGPDVARLYFAHENPFVQCAIPEGITIMERFTENLLQPFLHLNFILVSVNSYRISWHGEVIMELNPQRQWSVRAPLNHAVTTIPRQELN